MARRRMWRRFISGRTRVIYDVFTMEEVHHNLWGWMKRADEIEAMMKLDGMANVGY